jgi:hypothetical protein
LLVTPGAYPRRKHLKGAPVGLTPALPSNSKTLLERVSNGKPSSLLDLAVNNEGKKLFNNDTRSPLTKDQILSISKMGPDDLVTKPLNFFFFVTEAEHL